MSVFHFPQKFLGGLGLPSTAGGATVQQRNIRNSTSYAGKIAEHLLLGATRLCLLPSKVSPFDVCFIIFNVTSLTRQHSTRLFPAVIRILNPADQCPDRQINCISHIVMPSGD